MASLEPDCDDSATSRYVATLQLWRSSDDSEARSSSEESSVYSPLASQLSGGWRAGRQTGSGQGFVFHETSTLTYVAVDAVYGGM